MQNQGVQEGEAFRTRLNSAKGKINTAKFLKENTTNLQWHKSIQQGTGQKHWNREAHFQS